MLKNCQHCGQVIRIESERGIWVHNNGFATCLAPQKLGDVGATFAEPTR